MTNNAPDWEAFGKAVMEAWPIGDLDGFEIQDLAEAHKIILKVDGGFDPEKHVDLLGVAERGDDWFERNTARADATAAQQAREDAVWNAAIEAASSEIYLHSVSCSRLIDQLKREVK